MKSRRRPVFAVMLVIVSLAISACIGKPWIPTAMPDPETTTMSAHPTAIAADGESVSVIKVNVRDRAGNPYPQGGDTVVLATTAGSLGEVVDHGDGTYTAALTSGTEEAEAVVTGTLNGRPIAASATVAFVEEVLEPPTLQVPGDYPTIQAAIDAAEPGDTIEVAPGTYTENLMIDIDGLHLRSADPSDPAGVVIDGSSIGTVITIRNALGVTIEGLTIRNGKAAGGGGLLIENAVATVTGNVIEQNEAQNNGGGINVQGNSDVTLVGNVIRDNWTVTNRGGGIWVWDPAKVHIEGNIISGNEAATGGGGILLQGAAVEGVVVDNEIQGNRAGVHGGGIFVEGTVVISGNVIEDNEARSPDPTGGGIYVTKTGVVTTITGEAWARVSGAEPTNDYANNDPADVYFVN